MSAAAPSEEEGSTAICSSWKWNFLVVCICCTMVGGLNAGQAFFVKLFARAGIYGDACLGPDVCRQQLDEISSAFAVAGRLSMAPACVAGLCYDRYGARAVGTGGTVLALLGSLIIGLCLHDTGFDTLFAVGCVVSIGGMQMASFGLLGFLWHFPGLENVVIAAQQAAPAAASFLPFGVEASMVFFQVSMLKVWLCYCGVLFFCVILVWRLTPSFDEYHHAAEQVLGTKMPNRPKKFEPFNLIKRAWKVIMFFPARHVLFFVCITAMEMPWAYYNSMVAGYGQSLFGDPHDGTVLAEIVVIVNGIAGTLLTPMGGLFADTLGTSVLLSVTVICQTIAWLVCGVASWPAQIWCATFLLCGNYLFDVFYARYWTRYVPPDQFGTVMGLVGTAGAITPLPFLGYALVVTNSNPTDPNAYREPLKALCLTAVLCIVGYDMFFRVCPPPKLPPVLHDDEAAPDMHKSGHAS